MKLLVDITALGFRAEQFQQDEDAAVNAFDKALCEALHKFGIDAMATAHKFGYKSETTFSDPLFNWNWHIDGVARELKRELNNIKPNEVANLRRLAQKCRETADLLDGAAGITAEKLVLTSRKGELVLLPCLEQPDFACAYNRPDQWAIIELEPMPEPELMPAF